MSVHDDTVGPAGVRFPAPPGPPTDATAGPGATKVPARRGWRAPIIGLAAIVVVVAAGAGALVALARAGDRPLADVGPPEATGEALAPKELRRLERRLAATMPRGAYIVIDTVYNRLELWKRDKLVIEAPCSTGTGAVLADPSTGRRWVFDTPRGAHRVQIKLRDPVWKKPDWAFIEEGKPLPTDPNDRFDFEALGDYGLYFGDGYLIHGTLYQRLLGRSVTHGCIRLGDSDLAAVFRAAPIGTPIYIF